MAADLEELGRTQVTTDVEAGLAILEVEVAAVLAELEAYLTKTES